VNDPDPLRERIVGVFRNAEAGEMFTLDDLADEVRAEKKDRVAFVLGQLASSNLIDQVVRIMSPVGGGIQEYPSIDNIPDAIYDPFQLKEIEVEPSLVKVFFRKTRIGGGAASDSQSSRRGHALV
jgi:hypothetical protein